MFHMDSLQSWALIVMLACVIGIVLGALLPEGKSAAAREDSTAAPETPAQHEHVPPLYDHEVDGI